MIALRDAHIDILNSTTVEQGLDVIQANKKLKIIKKIY